MALLDIFKSKKKGDKVKKSDTIEEKKPSGEVHQRIQSKEKRNPVRSVLMAPHIAEKATYLTKYNQYVFKVLKYANKSQVKRDVEEIYNVDVVNVNIINTKAKKRMVGRFEGKRSGYKKAIVKLKEGQKIEIISR